MWCPRCIGRDGGDFAGRRERLLDSHHYCVAHERWREDRHQHAVHLTGQQHLGRVDGRISDNSEAVHRKRRAGHRQETDLAHDEGCIAHRSHRPA